MIATGLCYLIIIIYKAQMSFICHIHNYTEYNQQWSVFSVFNPSKCTHTWNRGQPTLQHPGSSWGLGALVKGLTSVVDNSCRSRDSNPQPRVTSPTLYPLEPRLPLLVSDSSQGPSQLPKPQCGFVLIALNVWCFIIRWQCHSFNFLL